MSYRSYPVYRSCNFDRNFIEVVTSIDNFSEVVTSMRYVYRSYNFDRIVHRSCNVGKISIQVVWIKFNTKIIDHLNDIIKLDSDT